MKSLALWLRTESPRGCKVKDLPCGAKAKVEKDSCAVHGGLGMKQSNAGPTEGHRSTQGATDAFQGRKHTIILKNTDIEQIQKV